MNWKKGCVGLVDGPGAWKHQEDRPSLFLSFFLTYSRALIIPVCTFSFMIDMAAIDDERPMNQPHTLILDAINDIEAEK